jgi:hypothetical protein
VENATLPCVSELLPHDGRNVSDGWDGASKALHSGFGHDRLAASFAGTWRLVAETTAASYARHFDLSLNSTARQVAAALRSALRLPQAAYVAVGHDGCRKDAWGGSSVRQLGASRRLVFV